MKDCTSAMPFFVCVCVRLCIETCRYAMGTCLNASLENRRCIPSWPSPGPDQSKPNLPTAFMEIS